MKKIAVVFPGVGYTKDRPLLHYAGKLAAANGYELIHLDFSGIDWSKEKLKDKAFLLKTLEYCLDKTDEKLKSIDLEKMDRVLFISKSIGTVVATAYAGKKNPFSEAGDENRLGSAFRRAVAGVKAYRRTEEPLNFLVLDRLMEPLSLFEKQRLTDYIIKEYEFIDFNRTVSYYKNYRKMVSAINDNTGAEYDVQEVFEPGTDKSYYRLMWAVDRMEKYRDIRQLLLAPEAERRAIGQQLQIMTRCSRRELEKYLRL